MNLGLDGKVAVVTAASKGIGEATVLGLLAEGATVACCARGSDALEQLQKTVSRGSGKVFTYQADLTVTEELDGFIQHVQDEVGAPSILVNNLGASPSRNFLYMTREEWSAGFESNFFAAVRCTQLLLPAMRKQRWGRVIMVASGAAKYPTAPLIDYSAAKAALTSLAVGLARRYGADGVLINSVLPGLIRTAMWEDAAAVIGQSTGQTVDDVIQERGSRVPVQRFGSADEVANLIVFLASERASYVNGASIDIDGGLGAAVY